MSAVIRTSRAGAGGVLSNLINPFGAQSAAGQALINSSYINGIYALGKETRWSVDGDATHQLGDAFNSGTPSTVALGFDVGGERFTYATTPYNDLVSAATGLTDSSPSKAPARRRRCSSSWTCR